jgi:hypothetical protein
MANVRKMKARLGKATDAPEIEINSSFPRGEGKY